MDQDFTVISLMTFTTFTLFIPQEPILLEGVNHGLVGKNLWAMTTHGYLWSITGDSWFINQVIGKTHSLELTFWCTVWGKGNFLFIISLSIKDEIAIN